MFRRYQLRFVTREGRVLRGPVFGHDNYAKFQGLIDRLDEMSILRMKNGNHRIVIPEHTLKHGYAEIVGIGPVRRLIQWLRSR